MKFNGNPIVVIYLIILNYIQFVKIGNISTGYKYKKLPLNSNPVQIMDINASTEDEKRVDIDLNEDDPLEYLKRKEELIRLYLKKSNKNENLKKPRFKQTQDSSPNTESSFYITKPTSVGTIGNPQVKEYHSEEDVIKIHKVFSESFYREKKAEGSEEVFNASNILGDDNKFWCSEGGHALKDVVKFYVEFEKSYRFNAMWIHWAFAPGEYKISYANEKSPVDGSFVMTNIIEWRPSIKGTDENWWKSIISNPKTRWRHKSFDERVNFDEPIWAKYFLIEMRYPVNQYYGIYKLEFYSLSKAVVMIKSKMTGEDLCLSVANGSVVNYSPVVAIDCIQALSYGDNRDLFIIYSNGFITTFKDNKCMESPNSSRIDILDCGLSSEYKDDRDKWIIDYEGKIRSSKEEFSCLAVSDESISDLIPTEDLKFTASSNQMDGSHNPDKVLDDDSNAYWASDPVMTEVVFEIIFHKYPYILKNMVIEWKFPAKNFKILGLFLDGYWQLFKKKKGNRLTSTFINFMNKDILGVKIIMTESTTKIEEKFVYGINFISLHTGARYLRREPCKNILLSANKFEIIDVSILDKVTGFEYNKAKAALHQTKTKIGHMENQYQSVPENLVKLNESSLSLIYKLNKITNVFTDLHLKLSTFQEFIDSQQLKLFTIATSKHFPANDCAHIIKAFPSKRSGMYWIKNDCMPEAQNVYCDFDSYDYKGGLDYLIYNNDNNPNEPFRHQFKNEIDIKYQCYKLGMEPIHIKNSKMLKNIYYLLKMLNYDLKSDHLIPLAYDYDCDISKCSKHFSSFNDIHSGDITEIINQFKREFGNAISSLFSATQLEGDMIINLAAFGKEENIVFENLNKSKISAVICSTNKDGFKEEKQYFDADCRTNLRTDTFIGYELFSNLRLYCPSGCGAETTASVYGTDIYTDNSSVCRAAIHAGIIKDNEENIVEVHVEPGKDLYQGSDRFNILSLDFSEKWSRSFSIKKYEPYCPIKKLKDYTFDENEEAQASSFMEIDNSDSGFSLQSLNLSNIPAEIVPEVQSKLKKAEMIIKLREAIESYKLVSKNDVRMSQDPVTNKIVQNLAKISNALLEDLRSNSFKNQESINYKSNSVVPKLSIQDELKSLTSFTQKSNQNDYTKSLDSIAKMVEKKIEQKEEEKIKSLTGFERQPSQRTTEQALTYVFASFNKEKDQLTKIQEVANDFKGIIGKTVFELNKLTSDKDSGMNHQDSILKELERKTSVILKFMYEIDRKIQNKLKQTEFKVKEAKDKLNLHGKREIFVEDYTKNINDNWMVFSSKKGKGKTPEWDFFHLNLNGHFIVIRQKGAFYDNRSGSHLILRNRDFYDFELKFVVLLKDSNTFGVAFRYKDPYNYYIFEVSRQEKGMKRIRKFKNGYGYNIDIKNDGGYNIDTVYNVKIRAQQSQISVYMTDYNGPDLENHYELQFSFFDNELVHGTIAFASNGMDLIYLDNFSIIPLECTNFDDAGADKVVILTPTCSRFFETFRNGFNNRWKNIDPADNMEGPSNWITKNNLDHRDIVLMQDSLIYGSSEYQEGSLYILKDITKICTHGKFMIKIKPLNNGIVGLVFRYDDNEKSEFKNFYILEVSGLPNNKFVRIRKKINNQFLLVSSNPSLGYEKEKWMKIILTLQDKRFNAFITEPSSLDNLIKVWEDDVSDTDIKYGFMGISTYKTKAIIDEVILSPFDSAELHTIEDDGLYVDEEVLNSKNDI